MLMMEVGMSVGVDGEKKNSEQNGEPAYRKSMQQEE